MEMICCGLEDGGTEWGTLTDVELFVDWSRETRERDERTEGIKKFMSGRDTENKRDSTLYIYKRIKSEI